MSEELKPCPICKGTNIRLYRTREDWTYRAECIDCRYSAKTAEIASDLWNELAALREENERLRQLMHLVYERARHGWTCEGRDEALRIVSESTAPAPELEEVDVEGYCAELRESRNITVDDSDVLLDSEGMVIAIRY